MWKWIKTRTSARPAPPVVNALTPKRRKTDVTGKYAALHAYLENRYADVVVLTFGQIEDLLGSALPDLARTYQAWWTGTPADNPPHSDAWRQAGRTAIPNLLAQTVVFERTLSFRHSTP